MRRLGGDWGFLVTDVGEGEAANDERLAYVFDRRAVRLAGLAGELVIAEEDFGSATTPLRKQFARSPYMVSFEAGPPAKPVGFTLISLHVVFGNKPADRTPEIQTFANRLKRRAQDPDEFGRNMLALGDFNIDRWLDDPNADAFRSEGLTPPFELLGLPRTIFDDPAKPHFYDQISWFTTGNRAGLTLTYQQQAGLIDWEPHLHNDLTKVAKSWRISDHYPLWPASSSPRHAGPEEVWSHGAAAPAACRRPAPHSAGRRSRVRRCACPSISRRRRWQSFQHPRTGSS